MSSREERARRRRSEWSEEVVRPGASKPNAYASLAPRERLQAFAELNRRVWLTAGYDLETGPRAAWPGEVFSLTAE